MRNKGIQSPLPVKRRFFGVHPLVALGILLSVLALSLGDNMEIIPIFALILTTTFFLLFHAIHDLLAVGLVIYATYKHRTSLGIATILVYLTVHIPYVVIQFPEDNPEILRILFSTFGAIFGVWLYFDGVLGDITEHEKADEVVQFQGQILQNMSEGKQGKKLLKEIFNSMNHRAQAKARSSI